MKYFGYALIVIVALWVYGDSVDGRLPIYLSSFSRGFDPQVEIQATLGEHIEYAGTERAILFVTGLLALVGATRLSLRVEVLRTFFFGATLLGLILSAVVINRVGTFLSISSKEGNVETIQVLTVSLWVMSTVSMLAAMIIFSRSLHVGRDLSIPPQLVLGDK